MPPHVMLSYQWDDQALVRRVYERLRAAGLPVWMDIEGGVSGNINDAMAAGVEDAAVICPFMTPAYQASRSCKKELNYADGREVIVVPVMLASGWEASEWLGLITAGLLWVDFRDVEKDEEHFEMCVRCLEEEIMFNAGHLLEVEEPQTEAVDQADAPKRCLKKKAAGRGFQHAFSHLYIHDSDEQIIDPESDTGHTVQLKEAPGDHCYWEEIKQSGFKYYRNSVTHRFLGFDAHRDEVHSQLEPSTCEEWLLLVDQSDQSHQRAVIIKHRLSGRFLAVRDGRFVGLPAYVEDCKWLLE